MWWEKRVQCLVRWRRRPSDHLTWTWCCGPDETKNKHMWRPLFLAKSRTKNVLRTKEKLYLLLFIHPSTYSFIHLFHFTFPDWRNYFTEWVPHVFVMNDYWAFSAAKLFRTGKKERKKAGKRRGKKQTEVSWLGSVHVSYRSCSLPSVECVQMMDGRERGTDRVGHDVKHVEIMTQDIGCYQ